jgi:hypothetical protein
LYSIFGESIFLSISFSYIFIFIFSLSLGLWGDLENKKKKQNKARIKLYLNRIEWDLEGLLCSVFVNLLIKLKNVNILTRFILKNREFTRDALSLHFYSLFLFLFFLSSSLPRLSLSFFFLTKREKKREDEEQRSTFSIFILCKQAPIWKEYETSLQRYRI